MLGRMRVECADARDQLRGDVLALASAAAGAAEVSEGHSDPRSPRAAAKPSHEADHEAEHGAEHGAEQEASFGRAFGEWLRVGLPTGAERHALSLEGVGLALAALAGLMGAGIDGAEQIDAAEHAPRGVRVDEAEAKAKAKAKAKALVLAAQQARDGAAAALLDARNFRRALVRAAQAPHRLADACRCAPQALVTARAEGDEALLDLILEWNGWLAAGRRAGRARNRVRVNPGVVGELDLSYHVS